jgi:hypothetical protein
MDVATSPQHHPTFNLEDEDPFFVGFVGTCPMFKDVIGLVGIIPPNIND